MFIAKFSEKLPDQNLQPKRQILKIKEETL